MQLAKVDNPGGSRRKSFSMDMTRQFKKSLQKKYAIKFLTSKGEDDYCFGVVTRITSEFVAIREIQDFEPDGMVVFPLEWIDEFVDDAANRCANRVLSGTGQIEKLRPPKWLEKCETLIDVLLEIQQRDIWPIIEVVDGADEWFFIGQIKQVDPEGITIKHYDAEGKWAGTCPIALPYVTKIGFDGRYDKHFNAYMKSRSRSKP